MEVLGKVSSFLACFAAVIPGPADAFSIVERICPFESTVDLTRKAGRAGGHVLHETQWISSRETVARQREQWMLDLKDKAREFMETDPSEHREQRLIYILDVIDTPRFQGNPRQYILDWIDRRGLTKEYRFVEDAALGFFRLEFGMQIWPNECDCEM